MLDIEKLNLKNKGTNELERFLHYPCEFVPDVHQKLEALDFEGNAIIMDSLIPLYEKAIQATYEKIKKIHEKGGTHLHLHNMATTFIKLIRGLKEKSPSFFNDNILQALVSDLIVRCDKIEALFLPIHDIWRSKATHYEKRLLIKPHWFDFENNWWCTLDLHNYSFVETYNQVYELASKEYLSRKQENQIEYIGPEEDSQNLQSLLKTPVEKEEEGDKD